MKRLGRLGLAGVLVLSGVLLVQDTGLIRAQETCLGKVCFQWAFGALVRGSNGELQVVSIEKDTALRTNDQLKMLIRPKSDCFVYLLYSSSQGRVHMLFPYSLEQFRSDYSPYKKYYIPEGEECFVLDENVGVETFYLLAATERLLSLEALCEEYVSAKEEAKKTELAKGILAEIRGIKRRHRKLTAVAERPVRIGGNIRGVDRSQDAIQAEIDNIAIEISAPSFYSRTFTIDHR